MPVEPIVVEDGPDLPPLWQVFGAARRPGPDGHWVLPLLSAEVASPDAALHLGPQFVLLETAAFDLVTEAIGSDGGAGAARDRVEAVSSHVMFLARGKVGPFRAEAELCRGIRRRARRRGSSSTTRATATAPSPPPRTSSGSAPDVPG